MANFYFTNKAVSDLTHIWDYTFDNWSERQADKYYNELVKTCDKISKNPDIGKKHFKIISDLYGIHVNRHIIFYRKVNAETVEITRILHEVMDLKNRLKE